jgi:hypothetical protein
MTRGRALWLLLLAVGFLVALLLRTPSKKRDSSRGPEPRPLVSGTPRATGASDEVEIEVADPREVVITPQAAENANETELVRMLADVWQSDPERALALAEQGERRFGESLRAVERRLYEIKALVKLGRIGSARTKAERYLENYPPGPMTDEVERLTGVHRRPQPEPAP